MSNEFVEILLGAALNKQSITKINNQIKQIQNDLKDIDIKFNVQSNGDKTISKMETQVKDLQKQIQELNKQLSNVGSTSSKSKNDNTFKSTEEGAKKALTSVLALEDKIKQSNGKIKIDTDEATGQIKKITTTIKNELGQIEKRTYKPTVELGVNQKGVDGLREITSTLDNVIHNDFTSKLNKATKDLDELGRQGRLTGKHFNELKKDLSTALTTTDIDKFNAKMKELNQIDIHTNKWTNATNNIKSQTNDAIVSLEKMKQQAMNLGLDTKQIDSYIHKMQQMSNIHVKSDEQMRKANASMSKFSSDISGMKNNVASYTTAHNSLIKTLMNAEHKGVILKDEMNKIINRINQLNGTRLNLGDKLEQLGRISTDVSNRLGDIKRNKEVELNTSKARRELEKLQTELTKVMNANKRTVNMQEATYLQNQISSKLRVNPDFSNLGQIERYRDSLKDIEGRIQRLNAEATRGSRANLGIIEAFKTAMER